MYKTYEQCCDLQRAGIVGKLAVIDTPSIITSKLNKLSDFLFQERLRHVVASTWYLDVQSSVLDCIILARPFSLTAKNMYAL